MRGQNHDHGGIPFFRGGHGRLGDRAIDAPVLPRGLSSDESIPRGEVEFRHGGFREHLRASYDLVHGLHDLHGVLPLRGLPRQHDAVGAVVYGVRDVGDLRAGRAGILRHGLEHLRGDDDRLPGGVARRDHLLLRVGDLLDGYFDAQVAARDPALGRGRSIGGVRNEYDKYA